MKLLIVGNNMRLAERIKRQLSKEFLIDLAHDKIEALDKLTAIDYAVTLFDPSM